MASAETGAGVEPVAEAHGPLFQFEVHPILPIKIGGLDLSFTNSSEGVCLERGDVVEGTPVIPY